MTALIVIGIVVAYTLIAGVVHVVLTRDGTDGDEGLVATFWILFVLMAVAVAPFLLIGSIPRWVVGLLQRPRLPKAKVHK